MQSKKRIKKVHEPLQIEKIQRILRPLRAKILACKAKVAASPHAFDQVRSPHTWTLINRKNNDKEKNIPLQDKTDSIINTNSNEKVVIKRYGKRKGTFIPTQDEQLLNTLKKTYFMILSKCKIDSRYSDQPIKLSTICSRVIGRLMGESYESTLLAEETENWYEHIPMNSIGQVVLSHATYLIISNVKLPSLWLDIAEELQYTHPNEAYDFCLAIARISSGRLRDYQEAFRIVTRQKKESMFMNEIARNMTENIAILPSLHMFIRLLPIKVMTISIIVESIRYMLGMGSERSLISFQLSSPTTPSSIESISRNIRIISNHLNSYARIVISESLEPHDDICVKKSIYDGISMISDILWKFLKNFKETETNLIPSALCFNLHYLYMETREKKQDEINEKKQDEINEKKQDEINEKKQDEINEKKQEKLIYRVATLFKMSEKIPNPVTPTRYQGLRARQVHQRAKHTKPHLHLLINVYQTTMNLCGLTKFLDSFGMYHEASTLAGAVVIQWEDIMEAEEEEKDMIQLSEFKRIALECAEKDRLAQVCKSQERWKYDENSDAWKVESSSSSSSSSSPGLIETEEEEYLPRSSPLCRSLPRLHNSISLLSSARRKNGKRDMIYPWEEENSQEENSEDDEISTQDLIFNNIIDGGTLEQENESGEGWNENESDAGWNESQSDAGWNGNESDFWWNENQSNAGWNENDFWSDDSDDENKKKKKKGKNLNGKNKRSEISKHYDGTKLEILNESDEDYKCIETSSEDDKGDKEIALKEEKYGWKGYKRTYGRSRLKRRKGSKFYEKRLVTPYELDDWV